MIRSGDTPPIQESQKMGKEPTYISTQKAVALAIEKGYPITRPTIVNWCRKFKIGHQAGPGSWWKVNRVKFLKIIEGRNDEQ